MSRFRTEGIVSEPIYAVVGRGWMVGWLRGRPIDSSESTRSSTSSKEQVEEQEERLLKFLEYNLINT